MQAGPDLPICYIHIGNKDVEQAQLARHGKATAQNHLSHSPLTKECPNCHKDMPIEAQYCDNCSKHQELTPVVKRLLEEHQQTMADMENMKAMFNKDVIEAMINARVKEMLKK